MNGLKFMRLILAMTLATGAQAGQIDHIDIFDNADNHLLFVTFEYDSNGKHTGRTVYASDSTFLRSTRFTKDANDNTTAENSVDYESNPIFTTRISPQSGKTNFTLNDQFNMDLLGATTSYTKNATGAYAISHGGTDLFKQNYEYSTDGTLKRISFTDQSGTPLYYATVSQATGTISRSGIATHPLLAPVFRTVAGGKLLLSVTTASSSVVTVEMFTPSGRLATKTTTVPLAAGHSTFEIPWNTVLCNGTYITRISSNGIPVFHGRLMITR